MVNKITKTFLREFNSIPSLYRSPGRVNILGEHTDYNGGFVLPAAIDKAIYVGIDRRDDDLISLFAADFNEKFQCRLNDVKPSDKQWPNYILGVVDQLRKGNFQLTGFNMVIDGDIPIGAGLSSSAAVECATAFALNDIFPLGLNKLEIVQLAQKAEHTFAGVNCGIMDQFASVFGKKDYVIKLDCRSLEYEYVPLKLKGFKIVLLNTNVKHSLSSSEYNTRRQQCEQGVVWVQEHYSQVKSLRDVTMKMLNEHVAPKDKLIYQRCKYVVEENVRLITGCQDLQQGNLNALGGKMFQTHQGLSRDYEVSCKELDFLVAAVKDNPAVLGARMMGGGFGGCTINLVKEEAIETLIENIAKRYKKNTGLELTAYVAQIENGTETVIQKEYSDV